MADVKIIPDHTLITPVASLQAVVADPRSVAGNYRVPFGLMAFTADTNAVSYFDNTGAAATVALGAAGTVLRSAGVSSAPTFGRQSMPEKTIAFVDSPYTPVAADNGTLIKVDTSSGAVVIEVDGMPADTWVDIQPANSTNVVSIQSTGGSLRSHNGRHGWNVSTSPVYIGNSQVSQARATVRVLHDGTFGYVIGTQFRAASAGDITPLGIFGDGGTPSLGALDLSDNSFAATLVQSGAQTLTAAAGRRSGASVGFLLTGDGANITPDGTTVQWFNGTTTAKTFTDTRWFQVWWNEKLGVAQAVISPDPDLVKPGDTIGGFLQTVNTHTHSASGAVAPDLNSGTVGSLTVTMDANGTSWGPTNVPTTTGKRYPVQVDFIQGAAGSFTLDLSGVDWGDAAEPSLGTTAGDRLSVLFEYREGGSVRGFFQGAKTA